MGQKFHKSYEISVVCGLSDEFIGLLDKLWRPAYVSLGIWGENVLNAMRGKNGLQLGQSPKKKIS